MSAVRLTKTFERPNSSYKGVREQCPSHMASICYHYFPLDQIGQNISSASLELQYFGLVEHYNFKLAIMDFARRPDRYYKDFFNNENVKYKHYFYSPKEYQGFATNLLRIV